MAKAAQQEETLTSILVSRWEQAARKVAELADAFPAERFESRPIEGVRTAGEVVRHIAFWNQYVADSLRGDRVNDTGNELPLAACPTKESAIEALRKTAAEVVDALRTHADSAERKTVELIMSFVEHTSEHYGQLVVYARMAGVVPPVSRT